MPLHVLDDDCTLHRPVVSPLHPSPQGLRHRNLEPSYHINQKLGALGRCLICLLLSMALLLLQGSPTFLKPRAISRLLSNMIFDTNLYTQQYRQARYQHIPQTTHMVQAGDLVPMGTVLATPVLQHNEKCGYALYKLCAAYKFINSLMSQLAHVKQNE